jgi:hypothetical protein
MYDSVEKHIHGLSKNLIRKTGDNSALQRVESCSGGNNKSWIVSTQNKSYFLKSYFFSKEDKRDRLGAEIAFAGLADSLDVNNIPKLLAVNRKDLLGLFQFIAGTKPAKEYVTPDYIKQALGFIKKLNSANKRSDNYFFPYASDACFSMAEHVASLEGRFQSLQSIAQADTINLKAKSFVENVLYPEWERLKPMIKKKTMGSGIDFDKRLCREERIISPSDFGFHNSILTKDRLFFIDFEYAGWDDPAKMVCDFFCQPEIPVKMDYYNCFLKEVSCTVYSKGKISILPQRTKILFPLYRLKWCCIMLNDFVAADEKRKRFASFGKDRRQPQLTKAIDYLKAFNFKDWH